MDDLVKRLRGVCLFSPLDWQEHVALAREAADRLLALEAVVTAAEEFATHGTVLTTCDRGPCQRVVEAKDNSDPQAKLYDALAALDKLKEGR